MKRIFKRAICLPLLFSLMSMDIIQYESPIAQKKLSIVNNISSGNDSSQILSNGLNNLVSQLNVAYEFYQMANTTYLISNYVPAYVLLYQIDIFLSDNVSYKGGFLNWLTGTHPAYIDSLNVNCTFNNTINPTNVFQTPSEDNDLCLANGMNIDSIGVTTNNGFGTPEHSNGEKFETAMSVNSISYEYKYSDLSTVSNLSFPKTLSSYISSSISEQNGSNNYKDIIFNNSFSFGYNIYDSNNNYSFPSGKTEYFAGPIQGQGNYNFSIFGAMDFESQIQPTKGSMLVSLGVTYGSSVYLDHFSSSTSLDFTI